MIVLLLYWKRIFEVLLDTLHIAIVEGSKALWDLRRPLISQFFLFTSFDFFLGFLEACVSAIGWRVLVSYFADNASWQDYSYTSAHSLMGPIDKLSISRKPKNSDRITSLLIIIYCSYLFVSGSLVSAATSAMVTSSVRRTAPFRHTISNSSCSSMQLVNASVQFLVKSIEFLAAVIFSTCFHDFTILALTPICRA